MPALSNIMNTSAPYSPITFRTIYGYTSYPSITNNAKRITIAIIDAYLYRSSDDTASLNKSLAHTDLTTFCNMYSLPTPSGPNYINVANVGSLPHASQTRPWFAEFALPGCKLDPNDSTSSAGWPLECALDVQWAWATTCGTGTNNTINGPNIILIHANSDGDGDLANAIDQAKIFGADVISMSWGGGEYTSETLNIKVAGMLNDFTFSSNNSTTFIASTGDAHAPGYPTLSPYVLAIGGTTLKLIAKNGTIVRNTEVYWNTSASEGGGGGKSIYESEPSQQKLLPSQIFFSGKKRAIPDLSLLADPSTGVLTVFANFVKPGIVTSYKPTTYMMGGTSLSAPCLAGLIAIANQYRVNNLKPILNTHRVLTALYQLSTTISPYCKGYLIDLPYPLVANVGYDLSTGLGVPAPGLITYLVNL